MIGWTLTRAAEAAALLDVDEADRTRWLEIAGKLAPYPVVDTPDGPVISPVPGDKHPSDRHSGRLAVVNLADEINLDSNPEDIELALRTARLFPERDTGMVFHLLGAAKNVGYAYLAKSQPSGTLDTHEARADAYWGDPERLLNSRSGRIHLFPCVPDGATVAFRDFQARNGFLVSAECRHGETVHLQITARRNVPCRFKAPWPRENVVVRRNSDRGLVRVDPDPPHSDGLVFQAKMGEIYTVERYDENASARAQDVAAVLGKSRHAPSSGRVPGVPATGISGPHPAACPDPSGFPLPATASCPGVVRRTKPEAGPLQRQACRHRRLDGARGWRLEVRPKA